MGFCVKRFERFSLYGYYAICLRLLSMAHKKDTTQPTFFGFLSSNETEKTVQQLIRNALAEPVVSHQGRICNYEKRGREIAEKNAMIIVLPSLLHIVH